MVGRLSSSSSSNEVVFRPVQVRYWTVTSMGWCPKANRKKTCAALAGLLFVVLSACVFTSCAGSSGYRFVPYGGQQGTTTGVSGQAPGNSYPEEQSGVSVPQEQANLCVYCGKPAIGFCRERRVWVCQEHSTWTTYEGSYVVIHGPCL